MKNRKRETCTSGSVRDEDGNILIYSANDRGDRGNVGIIRSPIRASILPDHCSHGAKNKVRCSKVWSTRSAIWRHRSRMLPLSVALDRFITKGGASFVAMTSSFSGMN
jgi:hypothetical protein